MDGVLDFQYTLCQKLNRWAKTTTRLQTQRCVSIGADSDIPTCFSPSDHFQSIQWPGPGLNLLISTSTGKNHYCPVSFVPCLQIQTLVCSRISPSCLDIDPTLTGVSEVGGGVHSQSDVWDEGVRQGCPLCSRLGWMVITILDLCRTVTVCSVVMVILPPLRFPMVGQCWVKSQTRRGWYKTLMRGHNNPQ